MAAIRPASSPLLSLLPRLSTPTITASSRAATLYSRQWSLPLFPSLSAAIPSAIHLNLPSLLGDIWESILRAVPKKKTSHSKKRKRFLTGKGLKDVTELNKCPACGNVKRAHVLCPYCVNEIKGLFKKREKQAAAEAEAEADRRELEALEEAELAREEAELAEAEAALEKRSKRSEVKAAKP